MLQTYYPNRFSTTPLCCSPVSEAQTDAVIISCSHVLVLIGTAVQSLLCLPADSFPLAVATAASNAHAP
jgi:hypothetical protein